VRMASRRSRARRRKVLSTQATRTLGSCQVRSKTESPCLHRAAVEIRGIPFCESCAREQEAYFAIGELTGEETQGLRGEPLARLGRQRTDGLAAARCLDIRSLDETERLALTQPRKAKQSQPESYRHRDRRPNTMERMEQISEDGRVLIRAAQEVHAERHGAQTFLPGSRLSFPEAARRNGIRSDRQRYYDALEDLEYEGAIEWDPSARYARGDKHYLITRRGLRGLRVAGTAVVQGDQQKLFEG
jgi:hypothetical protein